MLLKLMLACRVHGEVWATIQNTGGRDNRDTWEKETVFPPLPTPTPSPQLKMPLSPTPTRVEHTPPPDLQKQHPPQKREKGFEDVPPWKRILFTFTQESSMHGIRFTTANTQISSRRWMWLGLWLIAFSVFAFYVSDRVNEYLQFKMTVNVQVDYVTDVPFPAVTICNENAFRLSVAANGRWYNQVERLLAVSTNTVEQSCGQGEFGCADFSCISSSRVCDSFPDCLSAEDELHCNTSVVAVSRSKLLEEQDATDRMLSLETMYNEGSHALDDLVMGCVWKGKPCNASDIFREAFTDMGVCYRFASEDAKVNKAGPGYGLSLTLNIEQYDYTKNPETGVGIKVLLNDPWDVVIMGDLAFAISPGLYSLVAIEKTEVKNLEPPWGACGDSQLTFYERYSVAACQLDCENKYVRPQCNCRDLHMPAVPEPVPVCQVDAYINCARPKLEELRSAGNFCTCNTPCEATNLVPSLSFSSISVDLDAGGAAQQQRVEKLSRKLQEAREIRYRLARDKYRETQRMFFDIDKALGIAINYMSHKRATFDSEKSWLDEFKILMEEDCLVFSGTQGNIIQTVKSTIEEAIHRYKDYLLNFLLVPVRSMKRLFIDADRFLGNVSEVDVHSPWNQTITRRLTDLWWYIDIGLQECMDTLSQDINSTNSSSPEYVFSEELLPALLNKSKLNCSWCFSEDGITPFMELLVNKLWANLRMVVVPAIEELQTKSMELVWEYGNRTTLFNVTVECEVTTNIATTASWTTQEPPICLEARVASEWEPLVNLTEELTLNITSAVSLLDDALEAIATEAWTTVEKLKRNTAPKCDSELPKLFDEYTDVNNNLQEALEDTYTRYQDMKSEFSRYQEEYVNMNLSLSQIGPLARIEFQKNFITSQSISLQSLLGSRTAAMNRFRRQINTINYHILSQVSLEHYVNSSRVFQMFGVNTTNLVSPTDGNCDSNGCYLEPALMADEWKLKLDTYKEEASKQQDLLMSAVLVTELYFHNFIAGNAINDGFYKKNFLQLDLFYKELTEKSVSQQKAYEYPALLSELGGLMGLLLGASVLSVIEILDMLVYNGMIKCCLAYRAQTLKKQGMDPQEAEEAAVNGMDHKRNEVVPL